MAGYALAALGSCLILYAFLGINRKLLPGWAVYLGRISYGLRHPPNRKCLLHKFQRHRLHRRTSV